MSLPLQEPTPKKKVTQNFLDDLDEHLVVGSDEIPNIVYCSKTGDPLYTKYIDGRVVTHRSYGKCVECELEVAFKSLQISETCSPPRWIVIYEGDGLVCKECFKQPPPPSQPKF